MTGSHVVSAHTDGTWHCNLCPTAELPVYVAAANHIRKNGGRIIHTKKAA